MLVAVDLSGVTSPAWSALVGIHGSHRHVYLLIVGMTIEYVVGAKCWWCSCLDVYLAKVRAVVECILANEVYRGGDGYTLKASAALKRIAIYRRKARG